MNNTFAFNRFKNLLLKDGKMYFRNFGITLTVFCCLPVIFWIISLIELFAGSSSAISVPVLARFSLICMGVVFVLMLAPSKVYGNANLSQEGVGFAMLPASSLEKFLSMFLYCAIITPILAFFGSYLVDCLLTLLPFGGFDEPIRLFSLNEVASFVDDGEDVIREGNVRITSDDLFPIGIIRTLYYGGIIQWVAFFMLGNMLFKKHKAGKTFACILGIGFLMSFLSSAIIAANADRIGQWASRSDHDIEELVNFFHNGMIVCMVAQLIITVLLLFFTYRKIKTQKY